MQSKHIEFALTQILTQANIFSHFVPLIDVNNQKKCSNMFADECLSRSLIGAGKIDCMYIRNCDMYVDMNLFEYIYEQSSRNIIANKLSKDKYMIRQRLNDECQRKPN